MADQFPRLNVDILVVKEGKVLLGLLTKKWNYLGRQVYGVPGRDIRFGERIGDAVRRDIKSEFGCGVTKYEIISVNANYALVRWWGKNPWRLERRAKAAVNCLSHTSAC